MKQKRFPNIEGAFKLPSPLKWHGGKHYLAANILALAPPHLHYVEPFFGGGSVLLAKDPEGVSEVVNDLDSDLAAFWKVLAGDEETYRDFLRRAQNTPFCEGVWRWDGTTYQHDHNRETEPGGCDGIG